MPKNISSKLRIEKYEWHSTVQTVA